MKFLTRTIWILSLVSLFTDIASEMLYPVMPVYLKQIGFSVAFIGFLEGIAEAISGYSKGYFGNISDRLGRRMPFVQLGYTLSAISKPLIAVTALPVLVFLARSMDRVGKGLRSGARDAVLSDEAEAAFKGRVFGFHRAMDTLGAVIGPGIALLYLWFHPGSYRILFFISLLPGILSIAGTLLIKEKPAIVPRQRVFPGPFVFLSYWKTSSATYRQVTAALLVFTLFNSSDVFLLLKARESGLNDSMVIGLYMFYNLAYAGASYPMGILADRAGMKRILVLGLCLFAAAYAGMAFANSAPAFLLLFLIYGLYSAATEGVAKAWITNLCRPEDTGTAIGTYTAFQSICTMVASIIAGLIWMKAGPLPTFLLTAIVAICVAAYLFTRPFGQRAVL